MGHHDLQASGNWKRHYDFYDNAKDVVIIQLQGREKGLLTHRYKSEDWRQR